MKYINDKEKINRIKFNKDNFYVAIDFDRTITARESCDSWDACGNLLGEEYSKKNHELYIKYYPIELDYTIPFEEKKSAMAEWYNKVMDLFFEYNLTKEQLKKSINSSDLIFRKGAKEFLQEMHEKNIPVIILSAGIGNVIKQFLKNTNCLYDNIEIISNFLAFDENGNIKKYNNPIIHTLNKTIEGNYNEKIKNQIKNREYRLLFGDFVEDKKMIPEKEWGKTLSIRFFG